MKMNIKNRVSVQLILIASLLFTACTAKSPLAPKKETLKVKKFIPDAKSCQIYVFRKSYLGFLFLFNIYLDGRVIGSLPPGTFLHKYLKPGRYLISVITHENRDDISFTCKEKQIYFFELQPRTGWMSARAEIKIADPNEATKIIKKLEMVKSY